MFKTITFSALIVLLVSFTSYNHFRELVRKKTTIYSEEYPEKIYIQTDKPYYSIGESIWYSAYLVNGITHQKSTKSSIIYVELIGENGRIISKQQLYTADLSVAGDITLSKTLKAGSYTLRAYTNYMRNKGSEYFFQKEIPIWSLKDSLSSSTNLKTKLESETSTLMTKPQINFFPEGGNMVENLLSNVAIKATEQDNRTIIIKGHIKDSDGNIICPFKTHNYGLGLITLNPKPNKTYFASVIVNNEEIKYPLPQALPSGPIINIENYGSQIVIKLTSNDPLGLYNTLLVGHQRGKLIYEKQLQHVDQHIIKIGTNLLSDGVASFTLFDKYGKPICERLVFIDNPENDVTVNLTVDKKSPKTRDKVIMQLNLKDKDNLPISGNLSLSITDIDAVNHSSKTENIKTYLLINSDLRGEIENPGYFFEKNNNRQRRYLLDLVMLSHGWRRFSWTDLLYKNNKVKKKFEPEKGLYISGSTKLLEGEQQKISVPTRLSFMTEPPFQENKQSNNIGNFNYGPYVFHDSIPVLIEARLKDFNTNTDLNNRFVSIQLDKPINESPSINLQSRIQPSLNDSSKITNFVELAKQTTIADNSFTRNTTLLDEVVINARIKAEKEKRNTILNERTVYTDPSARIDMADYENQRTLNIFELLNTISGVTASNGYVTIRNQGRPKILVNGAQQSLSDITYMTGNDVAFIDVFKGSNAAIFSQADYGVIAIYTRIGIIDQNINIKREPGIIDFTARGFYTAKEFYAPDYSNEYKEPPNQDIRTTLHWEPKIILSNKNDLANITFFTCDVKSNYGIRIEGITDEGVPFCCLSTLEVN